MFNVNGAVYAMSRKQDISCTISIETNNRKVNALQLKKGNTPKKPAFTTLSDILFQQHYL